MLTIPDEDRILFTLSKARMLLIKIILFTIFGAKLESIIVQIVIVIIIIDAIVVVPSGHIVLYRK